MGRILKGASVDGRTGLTVPPGAWPLPVLAQKNRTGFVRERSGGRQ